MRLLLAIALIGTAVLSSMGKIGTTSSGASSLCAILPTSWYTVATTVA